MKKSELTKRLATMSAEQIAKGREMVRIGYGGHGMTLEGGFTAKQANAIHALVDAERTAARNVVIVQAPLAAVRPSDRALLLMVADECDITNPDGSAIPLTPALVVLIRAVVGNKVG